MARGLNKCMIIGNVGRDPEMRYTPQGTAVTSFSVAVNRMAGRSSTDGGDAREETEWFTVTAWNKLAETCNQFLTKGQRVYVEGRVQLHQWDGNDNQKHARLELIANDMVMLTPKGEMAGVGAGRDDSFGSGGGGDLEPDDIPF